MPSHPFDLEDFYQHAPCGFHALDAAGMIVAINDTELELLQRDRDEVVGKRRFLEFLTPASKQRFVRAFPAFKTTSRIDGFTFEVVRKDGTTVPIILSASAVYDDAGQFARSRSVLMVDRHRCVTDETLQKSYAASERRSSERAVELSTVIATLHEEIGERERAERLLRQSEERAVAVVNAAVEGMITTDDHGAVEAINPAGERIFGWLERELLSHNITVLMAEADHAEHHEQLQRYREGGDTQLIGGGREMIGRRRDGTLFPMEISISEVQIGARRLLHATVRDLTERKRAESRVAQLQEDVRRNEILAAIGSLLAGFAHEARNPLFGISAVLDAFTARFGERAEYAEHVALLRRDVGRLTALMQDLLEFGRPAAALCPRPLDPVLDAAVADCVALAAQSAVVVESSCDAGQLCVAMNERLEHALQNLLQNAIQFSPRGSAVTLAATVSRADGQHWVECSVRDHGPGITPDDLPHLFDPFFTRRRGGTGLGLAIVQRIVEEHRGTIRASNHSDGGAVIAVRLPLVES